jgi:hypothetical protein
LCGMRKPSLTIFTSRAQIRHFQRLVSARFNEPVVSRGTGWHGRQPKKWRRVNCVQIQKGI